MKHRGFTLIELLVAVSIVAVLSTIGFTLFQGIQSKARDSVRKQDLNKLALALELYNQKNHVYVPVGSSCSDESGDTLTFYNAIAEFISGGEPPKDPKTKKRYCYISVNSGKSFRLFAKLENCIDTDSPLCSYSQYNYSVVSEDLEITAAPN